ncbi:hypothetical protein M9Y10_019066 [Tritrichomonas musculus]|uniref:RING-type domain-containing protein n=1 Tax=Tritrichomonas musculus TaxID=1915356 RepID=A0ABR2HJE4_9EUKA
MNNSFIENLLENIQCPVCYLAMLPPSRTPMIILKCGHTVCESCISKIIECPFCHQPINKWTKNVLILQLTDSINRKHLISPELNPPQPPDNKLIPKIEPICTFASTGDKFIKQKWYQCRTCKITGDCGICEICAKKCHKGHDVFLHSSSRGFYCDCPEFCDCQSLPKIGKLRCTYEITYGTPIEQPMFQCDDCHITDDLYICQNCAIKCHNGHNLRYIGIVKNKSCNCFNQCLCQISSRKPICTFYRTGEEFAKQTLYNCKTCGLFNINGCCSMCAFHCHKGHDVSFFCYAGLNDNPKFFCDCGNCFNGKKCVIMNNKGGPLSHLTDCPNYSFEYKDKKIKQRKYNCSSCGMIGICEACAVNCHINHSVEFVGIESFCCACQKTNNCKMMMMPMLHNDRNCCDRSVLEKDDISACYTCCSCDKSGKIKICETCALKNHSNHDIHILGYMKFDCFG